MIRVLYDHQIFDYQKYGGISRYFYELMRGMSVCQDIHLELSLAISKNHYLAGRTSHLWSKMNFPGKKRLFTSLNLKRSRKLIKAGSFDLFHPTYYYPYFLDCIGDTPFVLTVHDMIHEIFRDPFFPKTTISEYKKELVNRAEKIIAVSENTKRDLIRILGVEESKIHVVHLGNSISPDIKTDMHPRFQGEYILYVGSRSLYKNFQRFIQGTASLLHKDRGLHILCIGGGPFLQDEIRLFQELGISEQVNQSDVDDSTLASFYFNARLFVFPSLYEGFGIPVLEAFSCSCPLVCSNVSSLPEVAGDAACYFNPYSEKSIQEAVNLVLNDNSYRDELILNGRRRVNDFTWSRTAQKTLHAYEAALGG